MSQTATADKPGANSHFTDWLWLNGNLAAMLAPARQVRNGAFVSKISRRHLEK
jgi:hypothetical protein